VARDYRRFDLNLEGIAVMNLNRHCGILVAALASIGMGTAETAFAQSDTSATSPPSTEPQHHHVPPHAGMTAVAEARSPLLAATVHATHELNLTADQKAQIRMILRTAQEQERVHMQAANPGMAVLGDPSNPGYSAAIQAMKTNATNRIQQESDFQAQVVNVLTPEQKAKLPNVLASLQAKQEAHRAASAEHPPSGLR
jgi:Spy/CpxP family protein refolding chaperone